MTFQRGDRIHHRNPEHLTWIVDEVLFNGRLMAHREDRPAITRLILRPEDYRKVLGDG